jgi:hypothetical protein
MAIRRISRLADVLENVPVRQSVINFGWFSRGASTESDGLEGLKDRLHFGMARYVVAHISPTPRYSC